MSQPPRHDGPPADGVDGLVAPMTVAVAPGPDSEHRILAVGGEIDVATSPHLREAISDAFEDARRVTIDLSATRFIDSSGLGVLVGALERSRELDRDLALRGLQEPVRRVFEITGLTELFAVED